MILGFFDFLNEVGVSGVPVWEQIVRVVLATFLGAILGMERELRNKPAGYITFMFVSIGACLIALLQVNVMDMIYRINQTPGMTFQYSADAGRIIAQVVSGIGFLGAGTIVYNKGSIKGITTAAMLWLSAGIGLLVGMGGVANYVIAIFTTFIIFPFCLFTRYFSRFITDKYRVHRVLAVFDENRESELYSILKEKGAVVTKTFFHNRYIKGGKPIKEIFLYIKAPHRQETYSDIINAISHIDWVISIEEA